MSRLPIPHMIDELDQQVDNVKAAAAYVEDRDTASRTYTEGQFILWKGLLYTVKPGGLPQGETISATYLDPVTGGGLNVLSGAIVDLSNQLTTVEHAGFTYTSDFETYIGRIINTTDYISGDAKSNLPFQAGASMIIVGDSTNAHILCIRANGQLFTRNKVSGVWDTEWINRW